MNWDVYVTQLHNGPPRRLTTNPEDDFAPRWSPNGQHIASLRGFPSSEKLKVLLIPVSGGQERQIGETSGSVSALWFRSLAWSPDSKYVVLTDRKNPGQPFSLVLLSVESGEKSQLTTQFDPGTDRFPPCHRGNAPTGAPQRRGRQCSAFAPGESSCFRSI